MLTDRNRQGLTLTFTTTANNGYQLTCMFLDCDHANSTQRGPSWPA